jgi:hypothetical protein
MILNLCCYFFWNNLIKAKLIYKRFWVQKAERGITGELLELGVGKDDIILSFIRPEYRQFSDFSVA